LRLRLVAVEDEDRLSEEETRDAVLDLPEEDVAELVLVKVYAELMVLADDDNVGEGLAWPAACLWELSSENSGDCAAKRAEEAASLSTDALVLRLGRVGPEEFEPSIEGGCGCVG
jgi:hypothetical protein